MIRLEVVTPERKVLDENVDSVEVPGLDGELGILPGHTELVSKLKPAGLLTYHIGDTRGQMIISNGYVEVGPTRVTVLADMAAKPEEIDVNEARAEKEHAEKLLQKAMGDSADVSIDEALAQLEVIVAARLLGHVAVHLLDLGLQLDRVHCGRHGPSPCSSPGRDSRSFLNNTPLWHACQENS